VLCSFALLQQKDDEKSCQKSDPVLTTGNSGASDDTKPRVGASVCSEAEELSAATRNDDQGSSSAASTSTSERRVTRAAARSQNQQKGAAPAKERAPKTTTNAAVAESKFGVGSSARCGVVLNTAHDD
jgi:hypothetical protein